MPDRVKIIDKAKPCISFNFPINFTFSISCNPKLAESFYIKASEKDESVNKLLRNHFIRDILGVRSPDDLKKKYPNFRKKIKDAKKVLTDELYELNGKNVSEEAVEYLERELRK